VFDTAKSQLGRQSADQAIAQLPRVEDRLLALFWHLADRWGRRHRDDIAIGLPLTHEALGRLIGARRPTVSLGLRALAEEGALHREGEQWVLAASSLEQLGAHAPARARPRAVPSSERGVLVAVPEPEPPGSGEDGHRRLHERVALLREQLKHDQARHQQAISQTREIRERVARARAQRAGEGADSDSAASA
jgi:hypothetical protein